MRNSRICRSKIPSVGLANTTGLQSSASKYQTACFVKYAICNNFWNIKLYHFQSLLTNNFICILQTITPSGFRIGIKLEAVDRKNPSLICVASVTDIIDNRFLVHFDDWDDTYDYW